MLLLSIVLFALALAIPAIPGILEVLRPKDDGRLRISERYVRDPRFFGRAFREKLAPFVAAARGDASYERDVQLRTEEEVRWAPEMTVPANERSYGITIGDRVIVGENAGLRDAYALESLRVESGVVARTLTSDQTLTIAQKVRVLRWIDADGEIDVGADSNLGLSAAGGTTVRLHDRVSFERVWGSPVLSDSGADQIVAFASDRKVQLIEQQHVTEGKPMIIYGAVRVADGTHISSDLKVHGPIFVGENVTITGNVISRGNVTFAGRATVGGHVFSEGDVEIGPYTRIGPAGHAKTVYATGNILLHHDVGVYGWIVAENGGMTR